MSLWDRLLERPEPDGHLVQFYDCDESLAQSAGRFLFRGFVQSDGLLIIAEPGHQDLFRTYLESMRVDTVSAEERGQLLFLDARRTLDSFMRQGQPDWNLFEAAIGNAMAIVRPRAEGGSLRAYAEMVGVLWNAGQYSAAVRLEQFWNKLLGTASLSLFCGYGVDVLGQHFHGSQMDALLCSHTHVVPGTGSSVEGAIRHAAEEILGTKAPTLDAFIKDHGNNSRAIMPRGEALVLGLRKELPDHAEAILRRARQIHHAARQRPSRLLM